jgi:predicted DNA-binding transcriptional regulator YafY
LFRPIELVIRVESYAAEHLLESPLAPNQTVRPLDDGRQELTASVVDTKHLRWWLTGFGAQLEVIAPLALRIAMRDQAEDLAAVYRKTT